MSSILVFFVVVWLASTWPATSFLLLSKQNQHFIIKFFLKFKFISSFLFLLRFFLFLNGIIDANKSGRDVQNPFEREKQVDCAQRERRGSFVGRILWRFCCVRARASRQKRRHTHTHHHTHESARGEREGKKLSRPKLRPVSRPVDAVRATTNNFTFTQSSVAFSSYSRLFTWHTDECVFRNSSCVFRVDKQIQVQDQNLKKKGGKSEGIDTKLASDWLRQSPPQISAR